MRADPVDQPTGFGRGEQTQPSGPQDDLDGTGIGLPVTRNINKCHSMAPRSAVGTPGAGALTRSSYPAPPAERPLPGNSGARS